jgi:hypothetical protein
MRFHERLGETMTLIGITPTRDSKYAEPAVDVLLQDVSGAQFHCVTSSKPIVSLVGKVNTIPCKVIIRDGYYANGNRYYSLEFVC